MMAIPQSSADLPTLAGLGAAWIFARSNGVWSQQGSKLVGTGQSGTSVQGTAVAVSGDGNTAIVGGRSDGGNVGAAWIYTLSNGVWTQQGKKLVAIDYTGGPQQGWAVALSYDGNTAVVGGPRDASSIGAVWVYTRSNGVWTQLGEQADRRARDRSARHFRRCFRRRDKH